ncbi:uncharacterized protein UTRI_01908 [Ustilago trichophora]|uniref:Uncharacterized protein n=1 Tax=Ustilago trichophora TaxID=86804 RepID=A0A5C3DZY1_9BASI|nr:uncharacterized protein UTRI_01908 [Ustilago trichophora]
MKVFASLLLAMLVAVIAVQANVQPTPAPRVEKRQSTFDPYNLSQYTNGAAISSLSAYINSQFGGLDSMSLGPDMSSYLASQRSEAYSYLSLASSIVNNGGASNSNLGSILGSLTATATGSGQNNGQGNVGSNSGKGNGVSNSGSAAGASATSSKAPNSAMGSAAHVPGYVAGMVACSLVAVFAGAFAL